MAICAELRRGESTVQITGKDDFLAIFKTPEVISKIGIIREATRLEEEYRTVGRIPESKEQKKIIGENKSSLPGMVFQCSSFKVHNWTDKKNVNHGDAAWRHQEHAILNGLFMVDIDHVEEPRKMWETLMAGGLSKWEPFFAFVTPSGKGLKIVMPADVSKGNLASNQDAFARAFGIAVDEKTKDASRLSFVSTYDDILLFDERLLTYENEAFIKKYQDKYNDGSSDQDLFETRSEECKSRNEEGKTRNEEGGKRKEKCSAIEKWPKSHTVRYLLHLDEIPVPKNRRPWNLYIGIKGARMNNLRGIDVRIPLNVMTVVTGVSGSGKSSLIKGILYPALKRHIGEVCDAPGEYLGLTGDTEAIKHIEFVDQNPIGKSTRSNPATYVKAYDAIRDLYAEQPLAQQMGFTSQFFSFNTDGGRCEECKGAGVITVEMQFMADLVLECEACHGHRFKKEILDVMFQGKNIDDVLNMTITEAIEFFSGERSEVRGERNDCTQECKTIVKRLKTLEEVGLGYIKLGQNSSTLSGGENQRVKLAYFIGQEKQEPTLFIFDEPTTGLHFHDIQRLLHAFDALIERGHTILVIEHNMEVIKCADYVIDLGPDGGDRGGNLVAAGTPEEVAQCAESITGQYLKGKIGN